MEWIWYFYLYSGLGFLLEVIFAWSMGLPKRDRKCRLLLPLCPVYGLGMVAILSLPETIRRRGFWLVLVAGAVATLVEYGAAWFYESVWRVRFWDYSGLPGNLWGRVCLPFALCWGVLAFSVICWVQPWVERQVSGLPSELLIPVTLVFALDTAVTGHLLRRTGTTAVLRWYLPETNRNES